MSVIGSNVLAGASGGAGAAAGYEIERSLRFNSADSAYLNRTPSSAGNRKTWTWSGWVKRSALGSQQLIFGSSTIWFELQLTSSDQLQIYWESSGTGTNLLTSDAVYRDVSAWAHITFKVDTTQATSTDRIKVYVNGTEVSWSSASYPTQNYDTGVNSTSAHGIGSRVSESNLFLNAYLAEVHFIDGQALAATDFGEYDDNNVWQPKEYSGTYGTNGFKLNFSDTSSNDAIGTDSSGNNNDWTPNNINGYIGDGTIYSASLSTNTSIVYPASRAFDGVLGNFPYGSHNSGGYWLLSGVSIPYTTSLEVYKGNTIGGVSVELNGSGITAPSNNAWTTIATGSGTLTSLKVSRGGDSFFFDAIRIDGTTILLDDNAVDRDSLLDSPTNYDDGTNVGGNYCTLNPLNIFGSASMSNGNLDGTCSGSSQGLYGTIAMSSGKWYWEITNDNAGGMHGIANLANSDNNWYDGTGGYFYYYANGSSYQSGNIAASYGNSYTTNDVIGVAYDADNGNLYFYKNGTIQNSGTAAFTGLSGTFAPFFQDGSGGTHTFSVNFGQRPFSISGIPTGYKPLCTQSFDDPTIADGSTAFDVALRTADTTQTTSVTGLAFSPDLIWEKVRSDSSSHYLADSVRGVSKTLSSNSTSGDSTYSSFYTSFNSDGYSIGTGDFATGRTVVGWAWDAGTSNTSISAGSLNSSVYNQDQVWSNGVTSSTGSFYAGEDATKLFDAAGTSTNCNPSAGGGSSLTFTPPSTLTYSGTVEIYSNGGTGTYNVNSGAFTGSYSSSAWTTVATGGGTISSIVVTGTNYPAWAAVRVDGKLLVDNGVTPVDVPSIVSTVRANPSAGFSIVSYTGNGTLGATVGHGLGANVALYFVKNRSNAANWAVLGHALNDAFGGSNKYLLLNSTAAAGNAGQGPGNTSTIELYNDATNNANGDDYLALCWAAVEGYSAFGSYTGNGSTDGPFVFLGFKPAVIIFKNADSSVTQWDIYDTTRDPDNLTTTRLFPSASNAESNDYDFFDVLSNGFKIRNSNAGNNGSGNTIIYAAWASNPFKTSRAH